MQRVAEPACYAKLGRNWDAFRDLYDPSAVKSLRITGLGSLKENMPGDAEIFLDLLDLSALSDVSGVPPEQLKKS